MDLELSLSNGSLCQVYINSYVSSVSVETPTKTVTKSHRDQRKFFIDKLGTIGGTLGVSAGMSVISMIEVVVFVYIILSGIFYDIIYLWRKVLSFLNGQSMNENKTASTISKENVKENNSDDDQQIKKIYVSLNFR